MRVRLSILVWMGMAVLATPSYAQQTADATPYSAPAVSSEDVLQSMAARAGIVFVGTVTAVKKPSGQTLRDTAAAAVIEVDFTVEQPVRGVSTATFAMREWAGLWRDSPRFAPGQRLLMLLHAPGPGGLSSPVDGLDGAIPIQPADPSASPDTLRANTQPSDAAPVPTVDLRWLQARTLRTQVFADAPVAGPGVTVVGSLTGPSAGLAAQSNAAPAVPSANLARIVALLSSWQQAPQAGRSRSH